MLEVYSSNARTLSYLSLCFYSIYLAYSGRTSLVWIPPSDQISPLWYSFTMLFPFLSPFFGFISQLLMNQPPSKYYNVGQKCWVLTIQLVDAAEIFDRYHITYWASDGTLLGLFRDGTVIAVSLFPNNIYLSPVSLLVLQQYFFFQIHPFFFFFSQWNLLPHPFLSFFVKRNGEMSEITWFFNHCYMIDKYREVFLSNYILWLLLITNTIIV